MIDMIPKNAPSAVIQHFPNDPLSEIFLACLPPNPLNVRQPDPTSPPILFLHICSHWRSVALSITRIWEHLYHVTLVHARMEGSTAVGNIPSQDLTFLRWWKGNIGALTPSLRLAVRICLCLPYLDTDPEDDRGGDTRIAIADTSRISLSLNEEHGRFLLSFISSAAYLDLDRHYNVVIRNHAHKAGLEWPLNCPALHTLRMRKGFREGRNISFDPGDHLLEEPYDSYRLIPVKSTQPIHRFHLNGIYIDTREESPPLVSPIPLIMWKTMTHISAIKLCIHIDNWLVLIRECRSLIVGEFLVDVLRSAPDQHRPVKRSNLPRLRQLVFRAILGGNLNISPLIGLELPSLTALRLETSGPADVLSLHQILESTPRLQELHLAPYHPSSHGTVYPLLPDPNNVGQPLWSYVPELEFLHFSGILEVPRVPEPMYRPLMKQALESPWLDLKRPENRLKTISFEEDALMNQTELESMLEEIKSTIPKDVEFIIRLDKMRKLWRQNGSGGFGDMHFREIL